MKKNKNTEKSECKNCGNCIEHYFDVDNGWRHFEGDNFYYHCKLPDSIKKDIHAEPTENRSPKKQILNLKNMNKKVVSEIWFNWRVEEHHKIITIDDRHQAVITRQDALTKYRIGEIHNMERGSLKCLKIEIDYAQGLHAEITWEDGSVEQQWNLNKIIEINEE